MGKYLVLWEIDNAKVPVDRKERGAAFKYSVGQVKESIKKGTIKDWGPFVGEHRGYAVVEGTEAEVGIECQLHKPFATHKVHPVASVEQAEEVIEDLLTQE